MDWWWFGSCGWSVRGGRGDGGGKEGLKETSTSSSSTVSLEARVLPRCWSLAPVYALGIELRPRAAPVYQQQSPPKLEWPPRGDGRE